MKSLRTTFLLGFGLVLAVCSSGCGGFAASRSVSPLDFIAPRVQVTPPAPAPLAPVPVVAGADATSKAVATSAAF